MHSNVYFQSRLVWIQQQRWLAGRKIASLFCSVVPFAPLFGQWCFSRGIETRKRSKMPHKLEPEYQTSTKPRLGRFKQLCHWSSRILGCLVSFVSTKHSTKWKLARCWHWNQTCDSWKWKTHQHLIHKIWSASPTQERFGAGVFSDVRTAWEPEIPKHERRELAFRVCQHYLGSLNLSLGTDFCSRQRRQVETCKRSCCFLPDRPRLHQEN